MRSKQLAIILTTTIAGCTASDDFDTFDENYAEQLPGDDAAIEELVADERPLATAGDYAVLLVDLTGSMLTIRSTGNTRCTDAKIMAEGAVNEFFDKGGAGFALWGFRTSGSTSDDVQETSTGYFTTREEALNAVSSLLNCSGSTPLADALCKGINGDGEFFTLSPLPDQLVVLTDGLENSSNGPCSGPSGGGNVFTPGTWENNVFFEAFARGIRIEPRYWLAPTILASQATIDDFAAADEDDRVTELQIVADAEGVPMETMLGLAGGTQVMSTNCNNSSICADLQFFSDLAYYTGGQFGIVTDDNTEYPTSDALDPASGPTEPDPGYWD